MRLPCSPDLTNKPDIDAKGAFRIYLPESFLLKNRNLNYMQIPSQGHVLSNDRTYFAPQKIFEGRQKHFNILNL